MAQGNEPVDPCVCPPDRSGKAHAPRRGRLPRAARRGRRCARLTPSLPWVSSIGHQPADQRADMLLPFSRVAGSCRWAHVVPESESRASNLLGPAPSGAGRDHRPAMGIDDVVAPPCPQPDVPSPEPQEIGERLQQDMRMHGDRPKPDVDGEHHGLGRQHSIIPLPVPRPGVRRRPGRHVGPQTRSHPMPTCDRQGRRPHARQPATVASGRGCWGLARR